MKDYLEEAKGLDETTSSPAPEDDPGTVIAHGVWTLAYAVIALVDRIDQIIPILKDVSRSQGWDLRI